MRNGRDRNSYRSLADTHSLGIVRPIKLLGGYATAISGLWNSREEAPDEGERERDPSVSLVAKCAPLARGEFPASSRPFQSVTLISGDFPYLSLSRLKLRSPPCDGSIVDVRIRATYGIGWLACPKRVPPTTPLIKDHVVPQMRRRTS